MLYTLAMESKTCSRCDESKSLDRFSLAPRGKLGRKASCKECDAARHAATKTPKGYNHESARARYLERMSGPKACTTCGDMKELSEFSKSRDGKYGPTLRTDCKACASAKALGWFHDNKDRANSNRRKWALENAYGMSVEEYDQKLAEQCGVCAICGQDEPQSHGRTGTQFRLAVDHDHETGRVRDLLCQKCNRAIGLLGDNAETLRSAAAYLDRHRESGSRQERK